MSKRYIVFIDDKFTISNFRDDELEYIHLKEIMEGVKGIFKSLDKVHEFMKGEFKRSGNSTYIVKEIDWED